jgi:hypothetical protein
MLLCRLIRYVSMVPAIPAFAVDCYVAASRYILQLSGPADLNCSALVRGSGFRRWESVAAPLMAVLVDWYVGNRGVTYY